MGSFGKVVLDYGDYLIRESELTALQGPNWLNDVIIGFYFDYLGREIFPEEKTKMKFVGPEITQCLKFCSPPDISGLMGDMSKFNFIFWPLNNSEDVDPSTAGGTHWSLLCYCRAENVIAHFDSSFGSNNASAESFARIISQGISPRPIFQPRGTINQENDYDCGVHVIINAEIIADYGSKSKVLNGVKTGRPAQAQKMRTKIIELINKKRTGAGDAKNGV